MTARQCDESRPRCTACMRREDDCVYPSPFANSPSRSQTTSTSENGASSHPASSASSRSPDEGPVNKLARLVSNGNAAAKSTSGQSLDQHDLRLLWHYMRFIATTDASDPVVVEIRQDDFVAEALEHPFLMEAMLSMSALHLRSLNDTRADWAIIAEHKKARALAGYMAALASVTEDNVLAAFSCSVLLPVTFFATSALDIAAAPQTADHIIQAVCTVFRLQCGIGAVMRTFRSDRLWKSRICLMMQRASTCQPRPLPEDTTQTLAHLRALVQEHTGQDAAHSVLCLSAIDQMERCMQLLSNGDRIDVDCEHIFGWPVLCGESYIEALVARDPPALAILACYGAVLHHLRSLWFIGDWGRHIVRASCAFLNPAWHEAAAWAQRQVEAK